MKTDTKTSNFMSAAESPNNYFRFHLPHNMHLSLVFGDNWFALKAEAFAHFFGTPTFPVTQTFIVAIWIGLNSIGFVKFDVHPFILLNLAFSLQTAYAAPLILLARALKNIEHDIQWNSMKSFLSVISIFLLIGSAAYAQISFSDKDLERYKIKSDNQPVEQHIDEASSPYTSSQGNGTVISRGKSGVYNGDYSTTSDDRDVWCQRGEQARAEIEKAESRAATTREHFETINTQYEKQGKTKAGFNEMTNAKNGMQQARSLVDHARKALDRLEDEAHRKGVHPGWLKCNFN